MVFGKLFGTSPKRKPKKTDDTELKQAAALLMYKMVHSDGVADPMELLHYKETLRKEFNLSQEKLDELLNFVTESDVSKVSLEELTTEIRNYCGNAKRVKMLEYLWILAFADDRIDKKEAEIVNQVAQQLYLSDVEMTRAQENAENVLGMGF